MEPLHKQIRTQYQLAPASHMTHIDNLRGICEAGGIASYNGMSGKRYVNISNEEVQAGRSKIVVPITGRTLHEYVPLYFGWKTPMVFCNRHQFESLIFLRFSLDILQAPGVVFSDGNARTTGTKFFKYTDINDLSVLDAQAINAVRYRGEEEKRRRKQAEILVPDFIPTTEVLDIIVHSEQAKTQTLAVFVEFDKNIPIRVNPGWYFQAGDSAK